MPTETRDEAKPPPPGGKAGGKPGGRGDGRGGRGTKRRGPRQYYREVVAELRKVIYPSRKELITYVVVVLVFVSAMTAITALLDFGFTRLVLAVFG